MKKTYRLTLTALFVALTFLLGMTPLGIIPLGIINVTILCVPVVIGTMLMGVKTGLGLGFCFGLASALCALGMSLTPPSALAGALIARSLPAVMIMCLVPRLLVPLTTWGVFVLFGGKNTDKRLRAVPFAAAAGSLTNTVFYLGLMLLFYTLTGLDNTSVLTVIGGTGLIAGGSEAIAAAILSTPILAALWKLEKKNA